MLSISISVEASLSRIGASIIDTRSQSDRPLITDIVSTRYESEGDASDVYDDEEEGDEEAEDDEEAGDDEDAAPRKLLFPFLTSLNRIMTNVDIDAAPKAKRQKTAPSGPEVVDDDEAEGEEDGADDDEEPEAEGGDEDEDAEDTAKSGGPAASAKKNKQNDVPKEDDLEEVDAVEDN